MRTTIAGVHARRIWDSRGRPTLEAEVSLAGGAMGRGAAPAGASRGRREAVELRDGGASFGGLDVKRAVLAVNGPIFRGLTGLDAADQELVDARLAELDGAPDFSGHGANAAVAVSLATSAAAASAAGEPHWAWLAHGRLVRLPVPEIQIFGGGAHAAGRLDIQDLMVVSPGAGSLTRALEIAAGVYRSAGELMSARGRRSGVADEGGWWPAFDDVETALDTLTEAIDHGGGRPGEMSFISLDIAASQMLGGGRYRLGEELLDAGSMADRLLAWSEAYPILSIEDPLGEDDLVGAADLTRRLGDRVQIVGDDLLTTNSARVDQAARAGACNALLVKPNQAGSLTLAKAALDRARAHGWATIVSARSGETEDATLAHLAVGWDAGQIKVGAFARGERMAKWNELIRIEEAMGDAARFAGWGGFPVGEGRRPSRD